MKRLVNLNQGWLELDIRTYRDSPRFVRWITRGGYSVLVTRYDSDGWSVGDREYPVTPWRSRWGTKLSDVLVDSADLPADEAEAIAAETIEEWKRRDADAVAE